MLQVEGTAPASIGSRDRGWRSAMRWTDLTLIAGLLVCVTGLVLMLRQAGRWARERSTGHLDVFGDAASLAALFGGIAVMQLGDVAEHISDNTLPADLWLSLVSGSLVLVVFGAQLGRLAVRLEMRRLQAARDTQSNQAPR
jgi:hypothetical protein